MRAPHLSAASLPVLVTALSLLPVSARAQDAPAPPVAPPAAPGVGRPTPEQALPAQPAPPASPPAALSQTKVVGFTLTGSMDPAGRLESLVALMVPRGSALLQDTVAEPGGPPVLGTVGRLRAALERLGYETTITERPASAGAGVELDIRLRAADRVRQIFVDGNWPLRQEEIIRRLALRPGQALRPAGAERQEQIERERLGVLGFLRDQGFLDAAVEMQVEDRDPAPGPVNLIIKLHLGNGYPLGEVTVEGNTVLSTEHIINQLRHRDVFAFWTQEPFRLSVLREDLTKLTREYQERKYAGARVMADFDPAVNVDRLNRQVRLKVTVLEQKRVEVVFQGNDRFDDSDLQKVLTLFERGAYDSRETDASAAAVAQHIRSKGHLFARVTWRADSSSPDVHRITFVVHEGPSLKVREVSFAGNQAFSASRLADVVTVRRFPLLGWVGLGEGGYASFRQLELDSERLAGFYESEGYRATKVRCEVSPGNGQWQALGTPQESDPAWKNARALHVRFLVEEAPRIDLSEIRFQSAPGEQLPHDESFLLESLDSKVGQPFRPELVGSDGRRLRRLMGDAAYPQASVEPDPTQEGAKVRLVWQIRLGRQLRAGPMFLRGNFLTREGTFRRWMLFRPGDLITTTALERSQRNLALIQLFNNASPISFPPEAQVEDTLPVLVEVEERHDHWGVARFGLGLSTDQGEPDAFYGFGVGGYGTVGYEHRNLFGQSWLLSSRGEYGSRRTGVDSSFTDPRLLGTAFRLSITGNYTREYTVRLGDIRSGSGTIGVARELFPAVDASLTYGWRRTARQELVLRGAGPYSNQGSVAVVNNVGSLSLGLEWQRLDNPLVPTRGFKLQGVVELALPHLSFGVGRDSFVKTSARALTVLPLAGRLSMRHSLRYDQGFPFGEAALLPKEERFFAGGDTTLRGFELDRARQESTGAELVTGIPFVQFRPIGGSLRILHNLDLLFQVNGPWYASVFADTGVVADSLDGLRARDFRHGAGIAPFLFRLPIGDLSIAWAWPLDPQPGDPPIGRLHFNVGLMF